MNRIKKAVKVLLDKVGTLSICLVGGFILGNILKWGMQSIIIAGLSAYILLNLIVTTCAAIEPRKPPLKKPSTESKTQKSPLFTLASDFDGDKMQVPGPKKGTMDITDEDMGESDPEYVSKFLAGLPPKTIPPPSGNSSVNISQVFNDGDDYPGEEY